MTVQEVQCIQSDMMLTRREVRGNEYVKRTANKREIEAPATTSPNTSKPTHLHAYPQIAGIPIPKNWSWRQKDSNHQPQTAHEVKAKRQDAGMNVPTTMSPEEAALVSQLQTAQYALELCNDNFNLTEICQTLRDPAVVEPLAAVGVDASQCGDIVCFASVYGIDLNTTNAQLLGDLAAAVYGVELGDNFTTTANTTRLCNSIDLSAAPYLGIDAGAINQFICGGPAASITVTAVTTQTVLVIPGSPTVTYTASGVGTNNSNPTTTLTASGVESTGGIPWQSGMSTGGPNGYPNGTFPHSTSGPNGYPNGTSPQSTAGSAVSGGAMPTGAGNPWGNSTGTDSLDVDFPQPSDMPQGQERRTPVALDAVQYYPASSTETITARYGRYD
jgi:hypothetical protein